MGTRRIRRDDGDFTLFFRKVSPFSNHHPVEFDCEEAITFEDLKRFCCTEQYYMYNKAMMIKDQQLMTAILNSDSPREMKAMCSKGNLRGWSDEQWDGHKMTVMDLGSFAKYDAAVHLRYALFLTMGSKLVECNPYDNIWGIGKDLQAAERGSLDTGENLLGKILDMTRDKMWERHAYGRERMEIENRVKEDKDYMMKAMKQVDLLYKARATKRYLMSQGHVRRDEQEYVTREMRALLPEYAIPAPIERYERIRPSPPHITHFSRTPSPPHIRVPPRGSRLYGRVSLPNKQNERRRSPSPNRRSRSWSRSRRQEDGGPSTSRRHENNRRSWSRSKSPDRYPVEGSSSQRGRRSHNSERRRRSRSRSGHRNGHRREEQSPRIDHGEGTSDGRRVRHSGRRSSRSSENNREKKHKKEKRSRRSRSAGNESKRSRRNLSSSSIEVLEVVSKKDKKEEDKKKKKKEEERSRNNHHGESTSRQQRSESEEDSRQRKKNMKKLLEKRAEEKKLRPPPKKSSPSSSSNSSSTSTSDSSSSSD